MFIDDATRVIVGWAIALTPHAGTVLTALRMGVVDDGAGLACGVPGVLRLDHGLEFAADAVRSAANTLGIEVDVQPEYHPNGKGKIERVNRTVDQMLLMMLPGFTEGQVQPGHHPVPPLARGVRRNGVAAAVAGDEDGQKGGVSRSAQARRGAHGQTPASTSVR